jgi:hypothetical protein
MRSINTGLLAVLAGVVLAGCSKKQEPCPSAGQSFQPLTLASSLATWDHASVSYDGTRVVVSYTQGALGNDDASSVWSLPVSCGGEVGSAAMLSRSLATGDAPALAQKEGATWFLWSNSDSATTETPDGGVADGGMADGGTVDAGMADGGHPFVEFPVRAGVLEQGADLPFSTDMAIAVTQNGVAYQHATQVHQVVASESDLLAFSGGRALGTDAECRFPFVQRFTGMGPAPLEQPDLEPVDALGCLKGPTALVGSADELLYLAWTQRPANATETDPSALLYSNWSSDRTALSTATTVTVDAVSAPSAASGTEEKNRPQYLAFSLWNEANKTTTLKVLDMAKGSVNPAMLEIPVVTKLLDRPLIAGAEKGGALAWTTEGHGMFVQRFTYADGAWKPESPVFELSKEAGTTNGRIEAITHLTGNAYFVIWSQPRSAAERSLLKGGFVTF